MSSQSNSKNGVSVKAYCGDAMTLLAFNLTENLTENCVGFTIQFKTPHERSFYLPNRLSFTAAPVPMPGQPPQPMPSHSSLDCPIQKFRWLHVPYSSKENTVEFGNYTYFITPRYWKNGALQALDPNLTVDVAVPLNPFVKDKLSVSFTRGFMISQAYARRFGNDTSLSPDEQHILFDTGKTSGAYPAESGNVGNFTYADQFAWMGWQARKAIMNLIKEVTDDATGKKSLDVLAYDFSEPDIAKELLALGVAGKVRIILDDHEKDTTANAYLIKKDFEDKFRAAAPNGVIVRGSFSRQAHCKVMILKDDNKAVKVLTGSTNFSINGLCVNANHVLILDDKEVADKYLQIFEASLNLLLKKPTWTMKKLKELALFTDDFNINRPGLPKMTISFAPHTKEAATRILDQVNTAIDGAKGSVLFAVMQLTKVTGGSVVKKLRDMHNTGALFSYGITDMADDIAVYRPGATRARLVSTQMLAATLPEPFSKEVSTSQGHRVHHKMVVLDFNDANPIAICGSSNLAQGGEEQNGDNLLTIYDKDVATVFAIEAIRLIDHFQYRAAMATATDRKPLLLKQNNSWLTNAYKDNEMDCTDRKYFIK